MTINEPEKGRQTAEIGRLAIDPKVVPFHPTLVPPSQAFSPETQACLDLILAVRTRIMAGEYVPTAILIGVIEARDDVEESFALSSGLNRMELIGNLHALASGISMEEA